MRLPGGRPFFYSALSDWIVQVQGLYVEATAFPGALLGPLPEGTHTFQVRLGGVRLPDATATVKAGRLEILRIRR